MKSKEEKVFKANVKSFTKKIGHTNATTDSELDHLGKLYIKNWIGVYSQNSKIPVKPKKASFIINTDLKHEKGSHWVAVHRTNNNTYYIYDSFGRSSKRLIPIFVKDKLHVDTEYDAEQKDKEDTCGSYCLAWLLLLQRYGVRAALKI